jgi:hypothetical protein
MPLLTGAILTTALSLMLALAGCRGSVAHLVPPPSLPLQGVSTSWKILERPAADQDLELDRVRDLASGHPIWVRIDWRPGDRRWDTVAAKARARGLAVIGLLNYSSAERPAVDDFARQAARLAKLTPFLNLLNEPDMSGWTPQDAAAYTSAAYRAAKAANPDVVVIGPSLAKTPSQHPIDSLAYAKEMMDAGARWDSFDLHLYGDATDGDREWSLWSWVPDFRQELDAHGMSRVPIITTEGGAQVDGASYSSAAGADAQQKAIASGMAARDAGTIASYGVYTVMNDSPPGGFGLWDSSGEARIAVATFKRAAR